MKIYFVRHGKTQWNQERRLQGMTGDSPLLPEALVEIAALGDYLSDIQFDAIFSSPSKRAIDTATILSEHNHQSQDIVKKTELFEWNLGIFEGMLIDEAYQKDPENMAAFRHHPEQFWGNPIGAENLGTPIGELRPGGVGLNNNTLSIVDYDGDKYTLTHWNEKHGR